MVGASPQGNAREHTDADNDSISTELDCDHIRSCHDVETNTLLVVLTNALAMHAEPSPLMLLEQNRKRH